MPVFKIHHTTKYQYDEPVKESINEIRIYPYQCPEQEVLQHNLMITGHPVVHTSMDYWDNIAGTFNVLPPHKQLTIDSKLIVRTTSSSEFEPNINSSFSELESEVNSQLRLLELSTPEHVQNEEAISEIMNSIYDPKKTIAGIVKESSHYIFENFQYIKGITTVETTVDEILKHRSGVCQDFAHVLLQILRTMKIPSRYVSGYICPNKNGMRGEGATHAWIEALIPGYGWAGIDPTNNIWVTDKHIKLAVGRNFNDCSPIKGTFKGSADQNLSVYVSVGYEDGKIFEELNDVPSLAKKKKASTSNETQPQQQ
jgi:transglutaminase-like putative cysteine protease